MHRSFKNEFRALPDLQIPQDNKPVAIGGGLLISGVRNGDHFRKVLTPSDIIDGTIQRSRMRESKEKGEIGHDPATIKFRFQ
jgi:hypothetical protein